MATTRHHERATGCGVTRRSFLADCGMGFTGLVLGAMLARDGIVKADETAAWLPPDGRPHFAPKSENRRNACCMKDVVARSASNRTSPREPQLWAAEDPT